MNRLPLIRQYEKDYHDACYETHELFEPGSWLHKPVKTILELMNAFESNSEVNVLDLGCGVGRNSIPVAQQILEKKGKVVCVDLLESAISKLEEYSKRYHVMSKIDGVLSDIAGYRMAPSSYDYIFSVSAMEHLDSEETFDHVLKKMIEGTKDQGVNCIIISTGIKETFKDTGESLEPMFELLFETSYLITKFETFYQDWTCINKQ